MKLGGLVLLGSALFFICDCNNKNPSIKEEIISVSDAYSFINDKYKNNIGIIPSLDSSVSWKIENDYNSHGALHIGMYLTNPTKAEPVSVNIADNVNINQERADEFKDELDYPSVKLMEIGHEAVNTLNPMIFNKLVDAQGSNYFYLTIKKINNKSLTIISELKEENSNKVYKRIHTYNENGYESKFELEFRDALMDYSFSVDFIYQ